MTTDQDPQSDSARLASMRRECSAVHPDVVAARRADDERQQAERDQATREDERQRLIAAGWKQPGIEEVRAAVPPDIYVSDSGAAWDAKNNPRLAGDPNMTPYWAKVPSDSDALDWAEKGLAEWRDESQKKARHLVAVQATARVAIGHLQAVLNKPRTHDEQLRADTLARDWLTSIGSEPD